MTKLPTLYKRTATGALQEWTVEFHQNKYLTRFGQVGGTIQTSAPVLCTGKNIGRANETTPEQQAELEARALWTKKQRKDYTLDPDVKAGDTSDLIEGGVLPMLAHRFDQHGDKIKYPCFVQPKLDGARCIGMYDGLWSRTRKPITSVPHIAAAVTASLDAETSLDGELYLHEYRDKFEEIMSLIRPETPKPGHEIVQYHVYDIPMRNTPFHYRLKFLQLIARNNPKQFGPSGPLRLVETREVANEDELMLAFEDFTAQGYEGAIVRNADGLYVNKRSYDLLKIKTFDSSEFRCIGVEEGKGKMAGHGIFVCQTTDGLDFRAKMKGAHGDLAKFVDTPERVVGHLVEVKHQGLTAKGIPRFPVALRLRDDL